MRKKKNKKLAKKCERKKIFSRVSFFFPTIFERRREKKNSKMNS